MNQRRGHTFYAWCWENFPEARFLTTLHRVGAAAIDAQSFLRWHASTSSSPRHLLDKLREQVLWHAPHVDTDASVHMGIINSAYETSQEDVGTGDVEVHLYKKNWHMPQGQETMIASLLIDDPVHLDQWPLGDPDLRQAHFDWTVFAWQWRVLVTREARQHYALYEVYNKLDESVLPRIQQLRAAARPSRQSEIELALDMNRQSHDTLGSFHPQWRGLLSAIRTLFASKCNTFYLHTCAADGLWLGLVSCLYALEQGTLPDQWVCIWGNEQGIDLVQLARSMTRRYKETRVALVICMLFWIHTGIEEASHMDLVLTRLEQGQMRPSKGADFILSLSCLTHGHGSALDSGSSHVLNPCNALCRAVWQSKLEATLPLLKPGFIVYPRVFWEAWNVKDCPDFTEDIVKCIDWFNLVNNRLVNDSLVIPPPRRTTRPHKEDPLYFGLVSHVGGQ